MKMTSSFFKLVSEKNVYLPNKAGLHIRETCLGVLKEICKHIYNKYLRKICFKAKGVDSFGRAKCWPVSSKYKNLYFPTDIRFYKSKCN